jgi:hypothetical protein
LAEPAGFTARTVPGTAVRLPAAPMANPAMVEPPLPCPCEDPESKAFIAELSLMSRSLCWLK